jgi:hypothetical protein
MTAGSTANETASPITVEQLLAASRAMLYRLREQALRGVGGPGLEPGTSCL